MNYQQLNGVSIREGFEKFHYENPHIYDLFEREAFKAIMKGKTKISSKMIINWIRWNEYVNSTDENFAINDAYTSMYARLFIEKNPDKAGYFELRKLRTEEEAPFMEVEENGQLTFL